MATGSRAKAQNLQKQMEAPLLQLEALGALDADDADEIRNIVAEGIAEKFQDRYRMFPTQRAGQIRRDRVPKDCVLMKRFDAHTKAIEEGSLPAPVAMARNHGNKTPAQKPDARVRLPFGAPRRAPATQQQQQQVPKGTFYRKPAAPEEWTPASKEASTEKWVLAHKVAPTDQKSSSTRSTSSVKLVLAQGPTPTDQRSSTSRSNSPEKLHKNWQDGLTSDSAKEWEKIMANPEAFLNDLTKPGGLQKMQGNASTSNQNLASPIRTNEPVTQVGQFAASTTPKDAPASSGSTTASLAADVTIKEKVDGANDIGGCLMDEPLLYTSVVYTPLLADHVVESKTGGVEVKTKEHDNDVPQYTTVDFDGELISFDD